MLGLDNPTHIAFLFILLLLVFGAKRLPELGRSLGAGMRGFKESITGQDEAPSWTPLASPRPGPRPGPGPGPGVSRHSRTRAARTVRSARYTGLISPLAVRQMASGEFVPTDGGPPGGRVSCSPLRAAPSPASKAGGRVIII